MASKKKGESSGLDKMRDAAAQRPPPKVDAKSLGLRIGIPIAIVWVIAFFVPHWAAKVVAGLLTALALGLIGFALKWTSKAQKVQSIVGEARTKEERHEALEKIDKEFKKGDAAAVFAK